MELRPSPQEARRIIASIVTFWMLWSAMALVDEVAGGLVLPAFFGAFGAGLLFYWTVFTVSGRETGRSAGAYMGLHVPRLLGPHGIRRIGAEGWSIMLKTLTPGWWKTVIKLSGWPRRLTAAILLGSFVLMLAIAMSEAFTAA